MINIIALNEINIKSNKLVMMMKMKVLIIPEIVISSN